VPSAHNPVTRTLELFGLYPTGGHLVKRVIGVGGDHVVCCDKNGLITVNGVPLHEKSYLAAGEKPSLIRFDVRVPKGYLWVQGDNRSNSADSRVHLGDPGGGFIPDDDVVGKVFMVVWPWDHATVLKRPATFDAVDSGP
jgi:signal peptidase I